ncbi:MAG: hypothetical protein ACLQDL_01335, partial [Spirochaetia bacterium]
DDSHERKTSKTLGDLGVEALSTNDLAELRSIYSDLYLEPRIDDLVTERIAQIVRGKISKAVQIWIESRQYVPCEVYVVDTFDLLTYQCHLENTYADDSIYIPEFPEIYGNRSIVYTATSRLRIQLDDEFSVVVQPHFYVGQSWHVGNVIKKDLQSFALPPRLCQTVLFAIIEDKMNPNRQYKVLWVIDDAGMIEAPTIESSSRGSGR